MPTSARYPAGRSQHFTFFRRELFQKVAAATMPFIVLPTPSVSRFFGKRPLPEFNIGDLVATDWLDENDEDETDFGEVIGLCYIPNHGNYLRDRKGLLVNTWAYYIYWTHSTCGSEISFPCFDGEPIALEELRLVRHV
jgi:hypothetical protein